MLPLGDRHRVVEAAARNGDAQIRPTPTEVRTAFSSSYWRPHLHAAVLTSRLLAHDVGPW